MSRYRDPQLQVGEINHIFVQFETQYLLILMFKHAFYSQ